MIKPEKGTQLALFTAECGTGASDGLSSELIGDAGDSGYLIAAPQGAELPLWSLLTVRFVVNGVNYMFYGQIIGSEADALKLKPTSNIMRSQRRSDLRLEVLNEVTGYIVGGGGEFSGVISDISTGGMSMRTNTKLTKGDRLRADLPVTQGMPAVSVDCEVMWHTALSGDTRYEYQTGCLFKFPYRIDKERLQKYILRLRRSKLNKFGEG